MVGVLALDQADVQRQLRGLGQSGQEASGDVGAETTRSREVCVRSHETVAGRFHDDERERLGCEHHAAAVCSTTQEWCECLAEGGPGGVDLGRRLPRVDLEREIEPPGGGELGEQVVEERYTRRDVGLAAAGSDAGAAHSSSRTMSAPSARRRSSIRS